MPPIIIRCDKEQAKYYPDSPMRYKHWEYSQGWQPCPAEIISDGFRALATNLEPAIQKAMKGTLFFVVKEL